MYWPHKEEGRTKPLNTVKRTRVLFIIHEFKFSTEAVRLLRVRLRTK